MSLPVIRLRARPPVRHPWIFKKLVEFPRPPLPPGSIVQVVDKEGNFVGQGFLNTGSQITLRLLTRDKNDPVNVSFIHNRLAQAIQLRESMTRQYPQCDGWRLVHGEADGLSGLIIDRFADTVVVEPYSAGWRGQTLDWVMTGLQKLLPGVTPVFRPSDRSSGREEADFSADAKRYNAVETTTLLEHGVRFHVNLRSGQKTGFFLDQRDNRLRVRERAEGKTVWDLCCYSGGFSLQAAAGHAARVTGVDTDPEAVAMAIRNSKANKLKTEFLHQNAFDFLRNRTEKGERADIVILDPAKLATTREDLGRAVYTYADLNRLGIKAVSPGGWLVTCSCSGLVSEAEFLDIVMRSANQCGRTLQITEICGAAPDHPFSSDFPEGRYLKAVFARVL